MAPLGATAAAAAASVAADAPTTEVPKLTSLEVLDMLREARESDRFGVRAPSSAWGARSKCAAHGESRAGQAVGRDGLLAGMGCYARQAVRRDTPLGGRKDVDRHVNNADCRSGRA